MKRTILLCLLVLTSCSHKDTLGGNTVPVTKHDLIIENKGLPLSSSDTINIDTPPIDGENRISFSQLQQYLPKELPRNCVSYKAGCNLCGLLFFNGKFNGYTCTELGCSPEPYECLYEHTDNFYTIPKLPDHLVFPNNYTLQDKCAVILNSNNDIKYYSLEYRNEGVQWNNDISQASYFIKNMIQNTEFFDFLGEKSLCLQDIYGNELWEHPENFKIFKAFEDLKKEQEIQSQKNNLICLNYHENCKWIRIYYRPENSKPASKYGGIKTYSKDIPNCTETENKKICQGEISEFNLKQKQSEFDAKVLNTQTLLRDRSICFNRIGKIESSCVRYESGCERCEVLFDPNKKTWKWNFQSKGCTQKYIKSNGGLPSMECIAYQE